MDFFSLYRHGFARVAACVPAVRVADPAFNTEQTIELARQAHDAHALLALFPELGLCGYSNQDLFFQEALLQAVNEGLERLVAATRALDPALIVGVPLLIGQQLYNCGLVLHRGKILGAVPKTYLPNYTEFYERRHFHPAAELICDRVRICDQDVPVGTDLIFTVPHLPDFSFALEICEDGWAPVPPSTYAALAGATVLCNLSASNITVGKDEYRHALAANQSARTFSAYLYSAAGPGESTTDLAWDGHALIYENGTGLAESRRFSWEPQMITADVDLDRLKADRMRHTSFGDSVREHAGRTGRFRHIPVDLDIPTGRVDLARDVTRYPFVPADPSLRNKRCYEVYQIQVQGLVKRLQATKLENLVIGVSGGLDSTQALIVCARAMDALGLPRTNIKAYTMPGFATSDQTYHNALRLMEALGVEANEIDIRPSCLQMMRDIGHPFVDGAAKYDVTFENVQAGERTSHLFRLANHRRALVVGTGDLSELALGWCTYGVGDHMSHYGLNASVPKTLIQYILRWIVDEDLLGAGTGRCLTDILNTEISPELVPGDASDAPAQKTEDIIGPYELQDFTLYHATRFGYAPSKIAFLAWHAWHDREQGAWPAVPEEKRRSYTLAEIRRWLEVFVRRFYGQSQFKRSCVPDGPKVGASLSPRGDWRAPSDASMDPWLADLATIPDGE